MLILSLRTDKPEAEIGLFDDEQMLEHETWQAHRKLAETLHARVRDLLERHGKKVDDLNGIVVYEGPGSFTGLRIGLSVANALAASYQLPMVGVTGDAWEQAGVTKLVTGKDTAVAIFPEYGAPVHITPPKR
jgi:tRNA threonylcarbamoyladenosine biosynthesis protein TsaB